MADFWTVGLSVATSLSVQAAYYVWLTYPGEIGEATADLLAHSNLTKAEGAICKSFNQVSSKAEDLVYRTLGVLLQGSATDDLVEKLLDEHIDVIGTIRGIQFGTAKEFVRLPAEQCLQALEVGRKFLHSREAADQLMLENMRIEYGAVSAAISQAAHHLKLYTNEIELGRIQKLLKIASVKRKYKLSNAIFVLSCIGIIVYIDRLLLVTAHFSAHEAFFFKWILPPVFTFLLGIVGKNNYLTALKVLHSSGLMEE